MKTKRKTLLLAFSALLLVAVSVMGTLAYLTATSGDVVNTFTVGSVDLTLDEIDVDEYGVASIGAERVLTNEYKLIPGHTYTKDPVVHVTAGSEESWVFIKVLNGLAAIEADTTIASQMATNRWTPVAGSEGVYQYEVTVDARENTQDLLVFGAFTISETANAEDLKEYSDAEIKITAYAVQADGLTAEEAYGVLFPATTP